MEVRNKVRGVTYDLNVARITVQGVPDRPGIASSLFEPLADTGISVDVIVQNASEARLTDLSFTVARTDLERAMQVVRYSLGEVGARGVVSDDNLAKVSVVGTGMQNTPGYASRMFRTLYESGINIEMITTSEIRITCIVTQDQAREAAKALHDAFDLDNE